MSIKFVSKNGGNSPRFTYLNIFLFGILVLLGNIPLWFFPYHLIPFQEFMVKLTGSVISASGLHVVQDGVHMYLNKSHWIMTPECTALSALIVFMSFVLVYPASVKSKGMAITLGMPFLIIANVLRLLTLAWASELAFNFASLFHDYVWQVAFLILIVLMWLIWIELVVNREKKAAVSL